MELTAIGRQTVAAAGELLSLANLRPGQLLVVGCSTSEVIGAAIGTAGSAQVAAAIFDGLVQLCGKYRVQLAVQCCEHLNRTLVLERQAAEQYNLTEVSVVPVPKAGGALAAQAVRRFSDAVVVESIQAHAGLDIGSTLIGMHLRPVAVPVRLQQKTIGQAILTAARTRPKLIGGVRAVYELPAE